MKSILLAFCFLSVAFCLELKSNNQIVSCIQTNCLSKSLCEAFEHHVPGWVEICSHDDIPLVTNNCDKDPTCSAEYEARLSKFMQCTLPCGKQNYTCESTCYSQMKSGISAQAETQINSDLKCLSKCNPDM